MAKYPIRIDLTKIKTKPAAPKPAATKPAPANTAATLKRAERMQALEAKESLLLKRGKPDIIRTTVTERMTPTKKGR